MDDDKRLERIEDKIDVAKDHLASIDKTLVEQHISLKDHMRRTELLEEAITPIRSKLDMAAGAIKVLGLIAALLTILEAIRSFK